MKGDWVWCPDGEKRRIVVEHRPGPWWRQRWRSHIEIGFRRYGGQWVSWDYRLTERSARKVAERRLARLISKQQDRLDQLEAGRQWRP